MVIKKLQVRKCKFQEKYQARNGSCKGVGREFNLMVFIEVNRPLGPQSYSYVKNKKVVSVQKIFQCARLSLLFHVNFHNGCGLNKMGVVNLCGTSAYAHNKKCLLVQ